MNFKNIGNYKVHDSKIIDMKSNINTFSVTLLGINKEKLSFIFTDVKEIHQHEALNMYLYSAIEIESDSEYRKFEFVNWDEEDDSFLTIIAKDFTYLE